jgi:tRNA threonylcarbamoyladenosine dehydratase
MNPSDTRFEGIARLYGAAGLEQLQKSHVCVLGIGGVGSWTVEALARSGVGTLTLVDLDEVCTSNINRQLHALETTVGRPKVEVMAARVQAINPGTRVHCRTEFFTETTAGAILDTGFAAVVDAIDNVENKCRLILGCRERGVPLVICGGAGARRDPTAVRIGDLVEAPHDRLLAGVRRRLRRDHGYPRGEQLLGIPCVYSKERPRPAAAAGCAAVPSDVEDGPRRLNCDGGLGSATFVTGAFGFAAAGWVVRRLASGPGGEF